MNADAFIADNPREDPCQDSILTTSLKGVALAAFALGSYLLLTNRERALVRIDFLTNPLPLFVSN
jgi:hypothetical protein